MHPLTDTEVYQETHYYPFGMTMEGEWQNIVNGPENNYLYNGKELNTDFGLDLHDYGARYYDAAIGRFTTTDRFAEKYTSMTPYQYGANNPIKFIDINGDSIQIALNTQTDNQSDYLNYTAGMETSDDYDEFTNHTINALNYIHKKGGRKGRKKLNKLINSESNFKILETEELGNATFEPISTIGGEINFNPNETTEFEGGAVSSVVTLAHELDHAYKNESLLQKAIKTDNFDKLIDFQSPIPGSKAKNKEENRAVKGLERRIARKLGQHRRKNYSEKVIRRIESDDPFKNY